jgi:hypothetical protein
MKAAPVLALAAGALLAAAPALAATGTASGGNARASLAASASLDFVLNIGRFIFFRVGPQDYPATSSDPAAVDITLQPTLPGGPALPFTSGNSLPAAWDGGAPGFSPVPASAAIPVQVRTNAGQISIRATVTQPLVSGSNSIPLSQIAVSSSDPGLPAPTLPDTGTGPSVIVTGTDFGNLVTIRSATWNFSYAPAVVPPPGVYTGAISYTAVSP